MDKSADAHPWLLHPLKGLAQGKRQILRDQVAAGWSATKRATVLHPHHRQYRLTTGPGRPPIFVDLFAGTCTGCARASTCEHASFAREMEAREFAVPTAEWSDAEAAAAASAHTAPAPAVPSWRERMAAHHRDLGDEQQRARAQAERERLAAEARMRVRLAAEREQHFPSYIPPAGSGGAQPNTRKRRATTPAAPAAPAAPEPPAVSPVVVLNTQLQRNVDRWNELGVKRTLNKADVPWLSPALQQKLLEQCASLDREVLKNLRVLWHPDRFSQHFRGKMPAAQFSVALAAVTDTAQFVNSLLAAR